MLLLALFVFVVTASTAIAFFRSFTHRQWQFIEYGAVVVGLAGVLLALSEISDTRRLQQIDRLEIESQTTFQSVMTRTEYLMEACGVWWNVVLDQTNKEPPACEIEHPDYPGRSCKETCRAGHFVMQHRRDVIGADSIAFLAENLNELVGQVEGEEFSFLKETTDAYYQSVLALEEVKSDTPLFGPVIQSLAHILIAIALGLEVGKIRHSA